MRELLEKIQKTNQRHDLFRKNDALVVGVSGGPDSTALFLLLAKLKKKDNLRLIAAHINHHFSKKESMRFERFASELARRHNAPFFKKSISVRVLAKKNKKTVEEMGRIARYDFFRKVASLNNAKIIATAHTMDDQAETMLMRVARGAGLKGLAGIPVKRREGACTVVRPLIGASKKQILTFLKKTRESFCVDKSNQSDIFTRNRVRNRLLPWAKKNLNPRVVESLSDLGCICWEAQSLLEKLGQKALGSCLLEKKPSSVVLSAKKMARLDPAVCSETIFAALALLTGGRLRFGSTHIGAVRSILESPESNLETHLPGPIVVAKNGGALRFFDTSKK